MGIRKRAKIRKRFRYNDAPKRRKRRDKKQLLPNVEEHAIQREWDTSKSAITNLDEMGLVLNLDKRKPSKSELLCVNKIAFAPKDEEESVPSTSKKKFKKKGRKKPEEKIVADELEEAATRRVKKNVMGGTRLPRDIVDFATMMLDKHGNNFKDMARDPFNIYQDTWKQIRAKIRRFVTNPRYFAPYLKERNRLKLPELPAENEMLEV